jgi:hypothetical protein
MDMLSADEVEDDLQAATVTEVGLRGAATAPRRRSDGGHDGSRAGIRGGHAGYELVDDPHALSCLPGKVGPVWPAAIMHHVALRTGWRSGGNAGTRYSFRLRRSL